MAQRQGGNDSDSESVADGRIAVCRDETAFHENTSWGLSEDGFVTVESTHPDGLFSAEEWTALRTSPWRVRCSYDGRLVLERVAD